MAEKRTKEDNSSKGGLNDGNPNADRTPIDSGRISGMTGGTKQANYEDEKAGNVPDKKNKDSTDRNDSSNR